MLDWAAPPDLAQLVEHLTVVVVLVVLVVVIKRSPVRIR